MPAIEIPEGFAFVPRQRGVNVALALLDAAEKVGAERDSVLTVSGGYHVPEAVADEYAANQPEQPEEPTEPGEGEGTEAPAESDEDPVPDASSTVAEIEAYAAAHEIELPDGLKADKLAAVIAASQP